MDRIYTQRASGTPTCSTVKIKQAVGRAFSYMLHEEHNEHYFIE
jgi:hypothetical protein